VIVSRTVATIRARQFIARETGTGLVGQLFHIGLAIAGQWGFLSQALELSREKGCFGSWVVLIFSFENFYI
jgi:hypothetical protein